MAKQDDYTRYTVRLPAELYERLQASAGDKSVNAEIILRLQDSFEIDDMSGATPMPGLMIKLPAELSEKVSAAARRMKRSPEAQALDTLEKSYLPPKG